MCLEHIVPFTKIARCEKGDCLLYGVLEEFLIKELIKAKNEIQLIVL